MDPATRRLFGPGRPMIGRARELGVLVDSYHRAPVDPAVVVITGEAGIGKSRLVAEFLAHLPPEQAVCGSCLQLAGEPLPFAAIEDARQQLATRKGKVTAAAPAPPPPDGPAGQRSQFERWLDRIEELADDSGPAVLVVEDLHWADESTLAFLTFVARSLPRRRVMLVMTRRDDQRPGSPSSADAMAELLRAPHLTTVGLRRLSADEVAELALFLCEDAISPAAVTRLWSQSEGNPYLLMELAAAAGQVPPHVQDVLLARVRRLDAEAQGLVRLAAVAGPAIDDEVLWRASSMDGDRYLAAMRSAVDAGVFVPEAARYIFRHSLTRDALLAQLLPLELRRLHASIARSLEDHADGDATTLAAIAVHWKVAGERQRAFPAACAAARQAFAMHAYAEAWRHFQWALELVDFADAPVSAPELLADAAEAARWSGDYRAAVRLLRDALRQVDDRAGRARLFERLGRCLWEAGDSGESHAAFSAAIDLLAPVPDSPVRPPVLAARARASVIMTAYARGAEEAEEAVAAARRAGLLEVEADALTTLGVARAVLGDERGVDLLRHALSLLDPRQHLEATCRCYANLAFVYEHQGRYDEACDVALQGLEAVGRQGLELGAGAALASNTAAILFNRGRYDECETLLAGLLTRGPLQGQALHLFVERAGLDAARGRTEAARESLKAAAELATTTEDPWVVLSLVLVEAEVLLLEGHLDEARDTVTACLRRLTTSEDDQIRARLCRLGLRVEADRAATEWTRSGDVAGFAQVEWLVPQMPTAEPAGEPNPLDVRAEVCTAQAEAARARRQDSPDAWRAAAELWRAAQRPRDLAYCLLREAERAAEGRSGQRAANAATEAEGLAAGLDAGPILQGLASLRRRAKLPVPQAPGRDKAPIPATQLTGREQEVLGLLARGATNREIGRALYISDRTAAVHVSSILRKLGVENRVQAATFRESAARTEPSFAHS